MLYLFEIYCPFFDCAARGVVFSHIENVLYDSFPLHNSVNSNLIIPSRSYATRNHTK